MIDKLLGAGADRIRQLRCNFILTPPIGLLLQPKSAQLDRLYSCHFLYAVRLRSPEQAYDLFDGPGRDLMEQALARRVDLRRADAREGRARPGRSAPRGGFHAGAGRPDLYQSVLLTRAEVITEADVEMAVSQRRQRLRDLINANGWLDTLVRISKEHQIHPDPKCMEVLFHYLAFKYNGDGWYDIHPLVAEIPEFVRARRGGDP